MVVGALLRSIPRRGISSASASTYRFVAGNSRSSATTPLGDKLANLAKAFSTKAAGTEVFGNDGKSPKGIENSEGNRTTIAGLGVNPGAFRPLSPHLTIYKPQLNSTLSISHRITGALLSSVVLFSYLLFLKMGKVFFTYESFYQFLYYSAKLVPVTAQISAVALSYHMYNGIRHLVTDYSGIFKVGRNLRGRA